MKRGGRRDEANSHKQHLEEHWRFKSLYDHNTSPSDPTSSTSKHIPDFVSKSQHVNDIHEVGPVNLEVKQEEGGNNKDGNKGKAEFVVVEVEHMHEENKNDDDDVVTKIEKLRLVSEEPVLFEELVKLNDQLQEDEVLAMEAIYGENMFILDNHNGLRSIQIHIHIDTPEVLPISTMLNSSHNLNTETSTSEGFSYSFEVKYIPPIILPCVLSKSYPSHLPP